MVNLGKDRATSVMMIKVRAANRLKSKALDTP